MLGLSRAGMRTRDHSILISCSLYLSSPKTTLPPLASHHFQRSLNLKPEWLRFIFCLKKKKEERVMIQFDISTSAFSSETKNRVWQKVENVWKLKITLFTSGCCCCSDEDKLRSCFCQPSSTTSDNNFNFVKRFGFGSVPSCWPSPPPSSPSSGNKTWQTIQEDLQRPKSSILLRATQNSLPLSGLDASVKQLQTRVLKREH